MKNIRTGRQLRDQRGVADNRSNRSLVAVLLAPALLFAGGGHAATTEVRDEVRGATFYSAEISSDQKTSLQTRGGRFSSSDVMTLGLSAFFFDESETVDDYVIWMRHDGPRRWFVGSIERPVVIRFDGNVIQPEPLHRSALADESNDTPLIEKLEFTLLPADLNAISSSQQVVIEVTTLLGTVTKTLSAEEISAISEFATEARERHDEIRMSTNATSRAAG